MSEVREPNYSIDLPGEWEAEPGAELGMALFREVDGPGRLSVMLLGVKPMYAIADQGRLLDDYMKHRSTFEMGPVGALTQSEPSSAVVGDSFVGSWVGLELDLDRRTQHHVVLVSGLLADFVYEAAGLDADDFGKRAEQIFRTITVTAE